VFDGRGYRPLARGSGQLLDRFLPSGRTLIHGAAE
jgi:hypothetical protein